MDTRKGRDYSMLRYSQLPFSAAGASSRSTPPHIKCPKFRCFKNLFFSKLDPPSNRKLKANTLPRQPPVDLGISIQPEINTSALLLIQHNLDNLAPVLLGTGTLANDFHRVDDIRQDGIVYGRQRAGVGTFLRLRRTTAVAAFRARKDPTGGKEEDMALGELLFEFAG